MWPHAYPKKPFMKHFFMVNRGSKANDALLIVCLGRTKVLGMLKAGIFVPQEEC